MSDSSLPVRIAGAMPLTLRAINVLLIARKSAGLSAEVMDIGMDVLHDPERGLFVRFRLHLDDDQVLQIDTLEPTELLRLVARSVRVQGLNS